MLYLNAKQLFHDGVELLIACSCQQCRYSSRKLYTHGTKYVHSSFHFKFLWFRSSVWVFKAVKKLMAIMAFKLDSFNEHVPKNALKPRPRKEEWSFQSNMAIFFSSDFHTFSICIFFTMDRGAAVESSNGSWQAQNIQYTAKLHVKNWIRYLKMVQH